jgi:hypothetical protein
MKHLLMITQVPLSLSGQSTTRELDGLGQITGCQSWLA